MPTQDLIDRKTMKIHTFNSKQQEKEQAAYTKYTTDKGKRIMTKEGVKQRPQKVKPKTKMAKEVVECMFAATQVPGECEDTTMASEWEESGTEVLQMSDMDIEEQKKHARAPKEQDEQMAMPDSKTTASPEPKKVEMMQRLANSMAKFYSKTSHQIRETGDARWRHTSDN